MIKLTTLTGLIIIAIDILSLFSVIGTNYIANMIKNIIGTINAVLFSISCTLYVFKFNEEVIKNDINNLIVYYWKTDLRVRGLEIIEAVESLGLTVEEIWEFRDSILFRVRLKHLSVSLEFLFLYFNMLAYATIYYRESEYYIGANQTLTEREETYPLNLYINVISPILSIGFSYITVLCDNVAIVKDYVKTIKENRDQEDFLLERLKVVIRYPLLSIFMNDEINEPTS